MNTLTIVFLVTAVLLLLILLPKRTPKHIKERERRKKGRGRFAPLSK